MKLLQSVARLLQSVARRYY